MRRCLAQEPLSEETVVEANRPFIQDLCGRYGRRLDPEEREAIALEAFFYAMRTYWPARGAFHPYAEAVVRRALLAERRHLDERIAHESPVSLDRPFFAEDPVPALDRLVRQSGRFENRVLFHDFMDSLPEEFRRTAWMLVDRCTREEIGRRLHLSDLDMDWQYNNLRERWLQYDA